MDQPAKVNGQKAMGFIFATLLIDVMGLAIIIPVVPGLIEQLIHGDVSTATRYSGWLTGCYAIMQFIFSPIIGNLSDRYGRRPVLLCSLLGFSVDYFFSAFAPTIGWLFIGRIVAGITGASFTTASAYISDVSTPEKKAANFGLIGVAFGLGFIIGPVIGGFLGKYNIHYPFIGAGALALINAVYGYFALPESLDQAHRRKFDWKRANPVGTLKQLTKYKSVMGLAISLFLIYFAAQAVQSVWTFYTIKKFGWNTDWQGYSLGVVGLLTAMVQGGLIRVTLPKLGHERSIWMGLLLYSLGLLLFAFASKGWMMFIFLIPYCLGGIAGPALQGYMSNNVPPNAQGELQGGLTSMMSLSSIFGPLAMTNAFYYFTNKNAPVQFPGAPYIIGALLMLTSALLAVRNFKKSMTDKADAKDNGNDIAVVSH
ncbi:DHA1 family tetracycline resistance protein-like MFS transporter [Mucilaginibacter yixingensis]|uniref:DHA1 family tetracycline resistance protein-like MFS transporter n=1 Tax=Mucilaginibacter yixingensis TaxID=1295612 RepID=A0A2T5JAF0_9SPHI|nr:TCR/Tet family MFS transporter [Mucilaginibacter yixingensis]PTQ97037.1 DHA1 family tetracycline resistance protein-like MFS transporter [Mucilaginibacter yixingensis]